MALPQQLFYYISYPIVAEYHAFRKDKNITATAHFAAVLDTLSQQPYYHL